MFVGAVPEWKHCFNPEPALPGKDYSPFGERQSNTLKLKRNQTKLL